MKYKTITDTFMPDWHLLTEPLACGEHYIGYYSALQIHNLITQPSLKEQIKDLPPFEQVSRELGRHFRKLFNNR